VGDTALDECERCDGVWLDAATFESVCRDRERRATLLLRGGGAVAPSGADAVRYLACPTCAGLMNRVNYARASGVIVDVCKTHGVWLDAGELPRLAAFVDGGGVDRVREREREQLAAERRQLELARAATSGARHDVEWPSAAASTRAADRSIDVLALMVRLLDDA
jgi:Zn-finger nucleic acid-binding protein